MSVTIKDVAQKANVALSTVSRVVNNSGYVKQQTRDKVNSVIRELGYSPNAIARNLHTSRTQQIGVVVSDITNPYFSNLVKAISEVLNGTGYGMNVCITNESIAMEKASLEMLAENRVSGLIVTPIVETDSINNRDTLCSLSAKGFPIILVDNEVPGFSSEGVFYDNYTGAYDATKLLLQKGHRRIAIIHGSLFYKTEYDRLNGYLDAHKEANITPVSSLQFETNDGINGTMAIMPQLLSPKKKNATAIFCCSNTHTIGCLKFLRQNGLRIPEDIAVIGSDEIDPYEMWAQNVSVVSQPTDELGRIATHTLLTRIRKEQNGNPDEFSNNRIYLQPRLVLRGSEQLV
ncbi:LacI family DNA-binding transcriptional regulator [Beduinella massiliensis]|uniref:LacI family DNA-binding transcriptional regulator n=1 Tax=Beduinella massiliensis TaxID=1852363 RepID=UPI0031F781A1